MCVHHGHAPQTGAFSQHEMWQWLFTGLSGTIGCFDVSWIRASLYTVIGGGFGVVLLLLLPAKYAVFIPPMHFTFEVSGVIVRSCAGLCRISVTNTTLKYRLVDILNINGKKTDPTV